MRLTSGIASFDIICGALACLIAFKLITRKGAIPKGFRLPPGPPGMPIIGNVMQMSERHIWETFDRWAKEYGELVYVNLLGQSIIVVTSLEITHDLFEKRSTIYSDRFQSPMFELMGFRHNIALMSYGPQWRRYRAMFHEYFNPNAAATYNDTLLQKTREFLGKLHDSPADFMPHFRHLAGSIIMEITYGIKVQPQGDPYIEMAEIVVGAAAEAAVPGRFLVDIFPILRYVPAWMPGAEFRRKAREWGGPIREMVEKPFNAVKDALNAGTARPSVVAQMLEDLSHKTDAPADEEVVIRNVGAVVYGGGADTTVSALTTFVLAMLLYPEVQRKAQQELDMLVGNQLPDFTDLKSLPYITALCKEVHRWRPVLPAGFAHRLMEDDTYAGYFIPAGSMVIGNVWSIFRNEKLYGPNPDAFEPERFLRPGATDLTGHFGFGRRICPGRHLADNFLAIAVASILKVFEISPAKDKNGVEIPVHPIYETALITHPVPFNCTIKPRSADAEAFLLQMREAS